MKTDEGVFYDSLTKEGKEKERERLEKLYEKAKQNEDWQVCEAVVNRMRLLGF